MQTRRNHFFSEPDLPVVSGMPRSPVHAVAEANTGLVLQVLARQFPFLAGDGPGRAEAYTAGCLGLVRAAERFDPRQGFTFSTYATECVRSYILRHLKQGRDQARVPCVSLETPLGQVGEGRLVDVIEDVQSDAPGQAVLSEAGFNALLAPLPDQHQEILRDIYEARMPLAEIGARRGLSPARCSQLHSQALRRLRKSPEFTDTRRARMA